VCVCRGAIVNHPVMMFAGDNPPISRTDANYSDSKQQSQP